MKAAVLALSAVFAGVALAAVFAPIKVMIDGKLVSSRAIQKDGLVYVPVTDLAKAMGKTYSFDKATNTAKLGGGATVKPVAGGGAFQAEGVDGKAGETLFNGITRATVATSFTPGDPYTTLEIEFRNAEKATKAYHFGYTATRYTLFDDAGTAIEGEMKNNDHYAVDLAQAEFRKILVSFRMPAGFKPSRLVIRLDTQVSGNPPRIEIFRVMF